MGEMAHELYVTGAHGRKRNPTPMAPTLTLTRKGPAGAGPWTPDVWLHIRDSFRLSDRELQIVKGILAEQEQDVIAQALGVSGEIVYRTTQRIYIKLHIGSRRELREKVRSGYFLSEASRNLPAKIYRAS
jgi:DNA-binding CsgD family transcriptional regulator